MEIMNTTPRLSTESKSLYPLFIATVQSNSCFLIARSVFLGTLQKYFRKIFAFLQEEYKARKRPGQGEKQTE
jgi:hypothetical protein